MEAKSYTVKIDGIDIISKKLNKYQALENDNFNHHIQTQVVGDPEKNLIVSFVEVTITKIDSPNLIIAEMTIAIGFLVENFKEAFTKDDHDKYVIAIEFQDLLKSISISTMRGIMYSEFRGTQLHRAVLPIILLDSLKPVETDLHSEIQSEQLRGVKL